MKILVLGAGVVGTATAWYAREAGHEVDLLDRRDAPGLETSFANGGQVSACHAEPWANPGAPAKIARWIWRNDAPLLFRLRLDPRQWSWGLRFLLECTAKRTRANTAAIVRMAIYSRERLQELRQATGIQYDALANGILNYFTDRAEFDHAAATADEMRPFGLERIAMTAAEAVKLEPALAACRDKIAGAIHSPSDESGDAHLFTRNLAAMAAQKGVRFLGNRSIERVAVEGGRVSAVTVTDSDGTRADLKADAYVVALGSWSPRLTRPLGIDLPIYPAKGYSATYAIADAARAPHISLTDEAAKLVVARLGDRLRVAGTAELSGYTTELNAVRCEALTRRVSEMFPGAADYSQPSYWTGLRPSTPSNVPIIGATRLANLFLNTGHGTLGWTMACGSGKALADIISGRQPEVDFPFVTPA
jgi:D-amino-acid dehydrogenase